MSKKKITLAVISTGRADYGLLSPLLTGLKKEQAFDTKFIVTGAHVSKKWGDTLKWIKKDGHKIDKKIDMKLSGDSDVAISKSIGVEINQLARAFKQLNPDLVIILGDRFELLGIVSVCICMRIPIAHLGGGHLTQGAIDEQVRHAVTKASHLHFVSNQLHKKRVVQMGEEAWRVCVSGSLGLDNIRKMQLPSLKSVAGEIGIDPAQPTALVTFHPTTLESNHIHSQTDGLLTALKKAKLQYVITYPNADPKNGVIRKKIERFRKQYKGRSVVVKSLGQRRYLSMLQNASVVIGNSSSAIIEAPSFNVPVVNIGNRQAGRLFSKNIIQSSYKSNDIYRSIVRARRYKAKAFKNPYGDGHATERIIKFIKATFKQKSKFQLLVKKFKND